VVAETFGKEYCSVEEGSWSVERDEEGQEIERKGFERVRNQIQGRRKRFTSVVTFLENKVKAASSKVKSFVDSNLKSRQNSLFQNNQSQLYKELGSKAGNRNEAPNKDEALDFWSKIWSEEGVLNDEPSWMRDVES